jgi:hypothetical protein
MSSIAKCCLWSSRAPCIKFPRIYNKNNISSLLWKYNMNMQAGYNDVKSGSLWKLLCVNELDINKVIQSTKKDKILSQNVIFREHLSQLLNTTSLLAFIIYLDASCNWQWEKKFLCQHPFTLFFLSFSSLAAHLNWEWKCLLFFSF